MVTGFRWRRRPVNHALENRLFMDKTKPRILMIGALPPPSIGPFVAMQRLVASPVLNDAFTLDFLDISDRRAPSNIGRFEAGNLWLGIKHAIQCLGRLLWHPPDLVYLGISQGTWGYLRDLSFILPALCLRRPLVLHLRGSEFRSIFYPTMPGWLRWLTRWMLARTAQMIVLGHGLRPIFAGLVSPDRIVVIPNGIDCQPFAPPPAAAARPSGKRILFLSSIKKAKGFFLLLEALPAVLAQHPDAMVTVAGLWQSDDERVEAEALITRLGLQSWVTFVGEVTGVGKIQLFHAHDVFVFTPVMPEGLPWVILEAMSAALPVVTTDQGAIAEVVEPKKTGFIVSPTPQAVADRIGFLLAHPDQARAMGEAGRTRVAGHFSEEVYLDKLMTVFRLAIPKSTGKVSVAAPCAALVNTRRTD